MDEEYKVCIKRSAKAPKTSEVSISKINGVKCDNQSGGYGSIQSGYSLHGYISYNDAMELVDCSGMHEHYHTDVKIVIPASLNKEDKYRKGYEILLKKARSKPVSIHKRTINGITCTKQIIKFLEISHSMPRRELRKKIIEYGYTMSQFQSAIYRLKSQGKISCPGDGRNPSQMISLQTTTN